MNILKTTAALVMISVSAVACSKVPAGYVGVKVNLLGGEKGVDTEELGTGRYWIGFNEELYLFPTFTQNTTWVKHSEDNDESIQFQSIEGLKVSADVGISYSIAPDKATDLFQRYRKGIDEITDIFLRNEVRDAFVKVASTSPIESVYGAGRAKLIEEVEKLVRTRQAELGTGINVDKIYWAGELRLPQNVVESINAKIAATQKAQQRENEIQTSKAEAQKQIVAARGEAQSILEVAKAQAEANKLLAESLTSELVQYKMMERWDGKMPMVSTGSGSGMLFNMAVSDLETKRVDTLKINPE